MGSRYVPVSPCVAAPAAARRAGRGRRPGRCGDRRTGVVPGPPGTPGSHGAGGPARGHRPGPGAEPRAGLRAGHTAGPGHATPPAGRAATGAATAEAADRGTTPRAQPVPGCGGEAPAGSGGGVQGVRAAGPSAAVDLPGLAADVVAHPASPYPSRGRPAAAGTAAAPQARVRVVRPGSGGGDAQGHRAQPRPCRRAGCAPAATRSATAVRGSLPVTSDSPTRTASAPSLA